LPPKTASPDPTLTICSKSEPYKTKKGHPRNGVSLFLFRTISE
jgi:hypothetical protein